MRYSDLIDEQAVLSSWISDITLVDGNSGDVTMALGNGKRYSVKGVGSQVYQAWLAAGSKGQFWHQNIKHNYNVVRLV